MSRRVSDRLSHHLRLLGCIGAVMVVYIHATTLKYGGGLDHDSLAGRIEFYFSHTVFHAALPLFFITSAFLLFTGLDEMSGMFIRLRSRLRGLAMPYLAWSALWVALVAIYIALLGHSPIVLDRGWWQMLLITPIPGQLWFLRDLIVLVAISPLLRHIPLRLAAVLAAAAFAWWLLGPTPVVLKERHAWYELISNEAITWFLAGMLLARGRDGDGYASLFETPRPAWLAVCAATWLLLPLAVAQPFWQNLAIAGGTGTAWLCLPYLERQAARPSVARLSSYSFLIYLGHHPLVEFIAAPLVRLAPGSQTVHLLVYAAAPAFVILTLLLCFDLLRTLAPQIVFILNGGRPLQPILIRLRA